MQSTLYEIERNLSLWEYKKPKQQANQKGVSMYRKGGFNVCSARPSLPHIHMIHAGSLLSVSIDIPFLA